MNIELALFWLFVFAGVFNLAHIGFYLAGANLYDIFAFKRNAKKQASNKKLPLISIVFATYNAEKVVVRTLESLAKLKYPRYEVIVVDNGSADNTRRLVRDFIQSHPKMSLRLVAKRVNVGKALAINYGSKNYAKGDFVMMLDDDSILHPQALRNVVKYFDDPAVAGVAANVRIIEEPSVLSVLQMLEHMISYRSKKAFTVTNCELIVGGVASTYRHSLLKKIGYYDTGTMTEDIGLSMKVAALGNKQHKLVYAADVVAATEGVDSFKGLLRQRFRWKYGSLQNIIRHKNLLGSLDKRYTRMLTHYRMPMAFVGEIMLLLEPLLLAYMLYLSYSLQSVGFIVGSYILITIYLLLNLMPDEHSTNNERARLFFYAPFAYFIFYIMNVVQVYAMIKCLFKGNSLIKQTPHSGTWSPPTRRGAVSMDFNKS